MAWIPAAIMAADMVYESISSHSGHKSGGSSPKLEKYKTLTHAEKKIHKDILKRINPKALDILNSPMFKQAKDYYQGILKGDTAKFEKPLMTQFNQEIAPEVAERFTALGARNSSGFNQAMGGAASNLSERLAMLREQLRSGAAGNLANMAQMQTGNMMGIVNQAFGVPSFGYTNTPGQPRQPGFMQYAAPGIGQAIGNYALSGWGSGSGAAPASSTPSDTSIIGVH